MKKLAGSDVVASLNGNNRTIVGSAMRLVSEDYSGLANGLMGDFTKRAEQANNRFLESETLRVDLKEALRDEVGVNIDEEMARLTVLQNSYAASARVIDTINQMLQELTGVVR